MGSKGFIEVEYTKGGQPVILIPTETLEGSGLCGRILDHTVGSSSSDRQISAAKTALSLNIVPFLVVTLVLVFTSFL